MHLNEDAKKLNNVEEQDIYNDLSRWRTLVNRSFIGSGQTWCLISDECKIYNCPQVRMAIIIQYNTV